MKTFKVLAVLLSYPTPEAVAHLSDLSAALKSEGFLPRRNMKAVEAFMTDLGRRDLMEAQEIYVDTFDRGRSHCLHLFEHVHGESRDRGQAMVDLAELYKTKGLYVATGELPDYLPVFLEYLSLCAAEEAKSLLEETVHIIAAIGRKLHKKDSPYAVLFEAIEALSGVKVESKQAETEEPVDLDKEWEEPPAFAGADCKGCGTFTNTSAAIAKALGETK